MSLRAILITLVLLTAVIGLEVRRLTIKPWPPRWFDDPEMHFMYGSIGAEVHGYPYHIWRELPEIFVDRIPTGFAEFGFISEPTQDLPIGVSVRRYGVRRVGFNCATCHTAKVTVGDTTRLVLGAPAEQLDLQAYIHFLAEVSTDPRLTAKSVFESAAANGRAIPFIDRAIIRLFVFPRLQEEVARLEQSMAWMNVRPAHGPGRTDAGNFWRSRWALHPERDSAVGTVDFPAVWNQRIRLDGAFHWDGNNSSLDERNISAALAGGTAEWLLDHNSLNRVAGWLVELPPPAFPAPLDRERVQEGRAVYVEAGCAACHDPGGDLYGRVTSVDALGTDPERVNLFTDEILSRFSTVGDAYSWQFRHYSKTDGYVNVPLDAIWMRGPYLHNGSVPTLRDLLAPAAERPMVFARGCTSFDAVNVGFSCSDGFVFDTRLRGNSNRGHEYGTTLSPSQRTALLEYLRSL